MAKKVTDDAVKPELTASQNKNNKAKIKGDTEVRVFNNTTGSISFKNTKGLWIRMRNKGYADVVFSDLENLYNETPQILESGAVYIAWQPVREKLGLDYTNIFALKDIEEILSLPDYLLLDKLHNAPRALQIEVAQYVVEHIQELRVSVVRLVERVTNINLMDFSEE